MLERYNPLKNIHRRLTFWLIFIICGLLADEYIKEGYLFKVSDVFIPCTHENIIVLLLIILFLYKLDLIYRG